MPSARKCSLAQLSVDFDEILTHSQSYDEEFCAGLVKREAPVLAQLARNIEPNSTAATQFCITFLGVCDYPKVDEWSVPFPSKPFCDAKAPAPSNKKPLKVIHYSDIHVDPLYTEGASTECKKPICCRSVYTAMPRYPILTAQTIHKFQWDRQYLIAGRPKWRSQLRRAQVAGDEHVQCHQGHVSRPGFYHFHWRHCRPHGLQHQQAVQLERELVSVKKATPLRMLTKL